MASQQGTQGRVYGGDCNLIHVKDGERAAMGKKLALILDSVMRNNAIDNRSRSISDALAQELCPGCYMVVGFNMLVTLARNNRQSLSELGRTMAAAFTKLADVSDRRNKQLNTAIEEILVLLDK